ncbi:uncharacterized protein [Arachis hypogaea]|uniref:uncharacterized protein isoform X2 n=1 Tax=Arachis hypogaea TaxID=3818 RepID=UPI000DEC2A2D|nr:uncharacterized protein LOC112737783 isoform X2 [Arachis hypogaea]
MPAFLFTAKALCSLASRRSGVAQLIRRRGSNKFDGCRCLTSIAGGATNQIQSLGCRVAGFPFTGALNNSNAAVQTRHFLGCGDGEEGVLSKIYEEKRVLGYSPEQLFDVVAAVDFYHGFVPWCQKSEILRHYPNGSFDAELEIGFKFLVESYVSHVELERPKRIKAQFQGLAIFIFWWILSFSHHFIDRLHLCSSRR